ncbi:hypothetical protein BDQ12DRAFT_774314 [Crucibulum laeve]|uniref:chitin deacetylase n=1 Tax=Crucibulum laeve TaxID=68775 RepID=A0A5C3M3U7_9AGAR|nr:hypothetical protein BDQ12DRAFT_774314 [Crucibulum laeve]
MKLQVATLVSALQLGAVAAHNNHARHARALVNRQAPVVSSAVSATPSSAAPASSASSVIVPGSASSVVAPGSASSVAAPGSVSATTTVPPPLATGTEIPPLASISFGMATKAPLTDVDTYTAGATPPVSGAPPLPTAFVYPGGTTWPAMDKVPPTDSEEVQSWMKELEGFHIPDWTPTTDGSCVNDLAAAAEAADRGWWTCGGHTRDTDIVSCPDKLTWGVSFDDGPSPYSTNLLDYLDEKDIRATFFVVGSRVIERPKLLVEEYMSGHEISVHTWSHRPLTSLTTEQVVAELGWTRKAIKTVLGITPTTMRPPFGDIDDRVRAISLAMGMVPIMWTRTPSGGVFDTNDWRVAGGIVDGEESFATFQTILTNASALETGFIVLQHDLYEITVDLAIGYTLDAALKHQPAFTLEPIGQCIKMPTTDLYLESTTNTTFPYTNQTAGGIDTDGDGKADAKAGEANSITGNTSTGKNGAFAISAPLLSALFLAAVGAVASL